MARRGESLGVNRNSRTVGAVEETDTDNTITLRVLYEDPEIVVVTAPNEDELREIVLNMLREGPKTLKDMHSKLAGIASEDKIRRCLIRLMDEGIVVIDDDGRYRLLGAEEFNGGGLEFEE